MRKRTNKHQGFTLIELLVAMAVSLLVITMVAGIFTTSRVNHDVQDDIAQMQENIRISSSMMRRIVFHAGHRARPSTSSSEADLALGGSAFGVVGIHGSATTADNQDALTVSYEGDGLADAPSGAITDCLGNPVGVGTAANVAAVGSGGFFPRANNRMQIRNFMGRPWLSCSLDNGNSWVQLVPDVEAMELQYGEDTDSDANADRFIDASQPVDFGRVIAVRLHLLFRTNRPIATGNTATTYVLGDQTYGPFSDLRVRRAIVITAGVRNAKL
jgi:type IV pilus assembly protein PilW